MIDRATKLRWRRRIRRSQHQLEDIGEQAEEGLERHFIRRLPKLIEVQRFVFSWLALVGFLLFGLVLQIRALSAYYQNIQPASGGIYVEGVLGRFTNANPLYASGSVDASVAKLVFSGLLKYDQNNQLTGDLAETIASDDKEITYTVKLRPNLKWHDGRSLTAEDVAFTYSVIQNPDAKSPLLTSWRDIKVQAVDPSTITFQLPNSLSAFPHLLTNGIVPKHLLDQVPMSQMRSILFNVTSPIGSGPFMWQGLEAGRETLDSREQRIGLTANKNYHLGKPKLDQLVIRTYQEEKELITALKKRDVQGAVGLGSVPDEFSIDKSVSVYSVPLTSGVYVFFKTSHEILNDVKVRKALVLAANRQEVIESLDFPTLAVDGPLLKKHLGYNKNITQPTNNVAEANKLLDEAGWARDANTGVRVKGGRELNFRLFSQATAEYTLISQLLQKQWQEVGAKVDVSLQSDEDLQTTIAFHSHDALLYGISLGSDPDVFVYWHSTQADLRAASRLNLSEYKSTTADRALEGGRTRSDPALRAAKYEPLLTAWRDDAPALALYQPRFLYLVHGPLFNFEAASINTSSERFNNVHNWMIRQQKANK